MSPQKLSEGKTKIIWVDDNPDHVVIESKDDLTAGDGKKHDVMSGKSTISTQTTCNVFRFLKACGIPLAFIEQKSAIAFLAQKCSMIPLEVVIRREAHGSYLKRHPEIQKGHVFPRLVLDLYLKTSGKNWKGTALPKDDPMIIFNDEGSANLYLPDKPMHSQSPILNLNDIPLVESQQQLMVIEKIARRTFLLLEKAWALAGYRLVDFKLEFGINQQGDLVIADVIDNDSWRVLDQGSYLDKQFYREDGDLSELKRRYEHVMHVTRNFFIPTQQILLWAGSDKDDLSALRQEIHDLVGEAVKVQEVVCSMHKRSVLGILELDNHIQAIPDSVVIALIGRSNGAGPTLSAHVHVPVITIPANFKSMPLDVFSSLRTPSETPVSTILEPSNAVLHALTILAMRNPIVYAAVRMLTEEHRVNVLLLN